jgi:hypothetical protein
LRYDHDLACERKVQEHECSDEFAYGGDQVGSEGADCAFWATVVVRAAMGATLGVGIWVVLVHFEVATTSVTVVFMAATMGRALWFAVDRNSGHV